MFPWLNYSVGDLQPSLQTDEKMYILTSLPYDFSNSYRYLQRSYQLTQKRSEV